MARVHSQYHELKRGSLDQNMSSAADLLKVDFLVQSNLTFDNFAHKNAQKILKTHTYQPNFAQSHNCMMATFRSSGEQNICRVVKDSEVQCCNTVQCNAMQCNAVQGSAQYCYTVLYSALEDCHTTHNLSSNFYNPFLF